MSRRVDIGMAPALVGVTVEEDVLVGVREFLAEERAELARRFAADCAEDALVVLAGLTSGTTGGARDF